MLRLIVMLLAMSAGATVLFLIARSRVQAARGRLWRIADMEAENARLDDLIYVAREGKRKPGTRR